MIAQPSSGLSRLDADRAFRDVIGPAPIAWRPTFVLGMRAVAVAIAAATLLPLAFVVGVAVDIGWTESLRLVLRPRVVELLVNTLLLIALSVPICIVLSVVLAWLTERTDLPGARLWAWLATAPLAIPAFVHSYAWTSLSPGLSGLPAGILVSVLAYFPFVYLPVAAALRGLDPALEDTASSLGEPAFGVFLRVVLPQLRLAICGGSLLVGLHLLAEYGLFAMVRFDTFTTAIVDQFQSAYNGPAASMLGAVLALCCVGLLGLESALRGGRPLARLGSGAARRPVIRRLGSWTGPALLVSGLVTTLALGVPAATLSRWLAVGGSSVWRLNEIGPAMGQTIGLAALGAVLTIAAALPVAWLSARSPGRLQRVVEGATYVVGSLPGVVVALALVALTVQFALPLYQTIATVLVAYVLIFLPRALVGLRASVAQAPVLLEEVAGGLGRSPLAAIWHVTVKIASPGVAASAALVSLGIANELVATQMLAPNGTETLATAFWSASAELDYAAAAPYGLVMVGLALPLTLILHARSERTRGR